MCVAAGQSVSDRRLPGGGAPGCERWAPWCEAQSKHLVIKPEQLSAFDLLCHFFNEDFRLKKKSLRSRLPEERETRFKLMCVWGVRVNNNTVIYLIFEQSKDVLSRAAPARWLNPRSVCEWVKAVTFTITYYRCALELAVVPTRRDLSCDFCCVSSGTRRQLQFYFWLVRKLWSSSDGTKHHSI